MGSGNDQEYINRLQKGDFRAYAPLVEKYKSMVYSIALKILKNPTEAEDIAQESFIKAYQQIGSFKKEAKFSTWLYTITYRTALYEIRKNRITVLPIDFETDRLANSNIDQPIGEMHLKEQQIFIKKAIDALPSMEGLLISLYYLDENSIQEIHTITGLSKVNIKVKLFRARKRLRNTLNSLLQEETKSLF